MFPFRRDQYKSRQTDSLIHSLVELTAGADAHYDRLVWLTKSPGKDNDPETNWFFNHLKTRLALLERYQDYFPTQWDLSNADARLLDLDMHTPRELEFFDLLNQHRFPCEFNETDFQNGYTVYALTPDWGELEWSELDCLVQCYAGLTEYHPWQAVLEQYGLQDSDIETPAPPRKVTAQGLKTVCESVKTPLKALWKAFEIIEHSTDNLWLDSDDMEPETLEWSRESIDLLTREYQQAQSWIQEFNDLNEWLYEKPERIKALVKLWNATQGDPNVVQLEIPFVTTVSSDQFVSGQYMRELHETRRHYEQLIYG